MLRCQRGGAPAALGDGVAAQRSVGHQPGEQLGHDQGLLGADDDARPAQGLGRRAGVVGDHRQTCLHRLQQRPPEAFVLTHRHVRRGTRVAVAQVVGVEPSQPADGALLAQVEDQTLHGLPVPGQP